MGFRLPGIANAKKSLTRSLSATKSLDIPKGYFAVYVGKSQKKRFVIPISYLNEPLFLDLLNQAEEEFGFDHPMGGITIPCSEHTFLDLTSRLRPGPILSLKSETILGPRLGSTYVWAGPEKKKKKRRAWHKVGKKRALPLPHETKTRVTRSPAPVALLSAETGPHARGTVSQSTVERFNRYEMDGQD
ncbi:hypothetical protein ACLB2K_011624 [Fragaria x ananassa]